MKNIILACLEQLANGRMKFKMYNKNLDVFEENIFVSHITVETFRVDLCKKDRVVEKELSIEQIEKLLSNDCNYKMIKIFPQKNKGEIYNVFRKVAKIKGVCAPFLELEDSIIYFPMLRYSDLDLLRYLCENSRIKKYKLLMTSGY